MSEHYCTVIHGGNVIENYEYDPDQDVAFFISDYALNTSIPEGKFLEFLYEKVTIEPSTIIKTFIREDKPTFEITEHFVPA